MFTRAGRIVLNLGVLALIATMVYVYEARLKGHSGLMRVRTLHAVQPASKGSQVSKAVSGLKLEAFDRSRFAFVKPQPVPIPVATPARFAKKTVSKKYRIAKLRKKRTHRKSARRKKRVEPAWVKRLIDFEKLEGESQSEIVNLTSPANEYLNRSLSEDLSDNELSSNPMLSSVNVEKPEIESNLPPIERVDTNYVATVKQNSFQDIQTDLAEDQLVLASLGDYPKAPEVEASEETSEAVRLLASAENMEKSLASAKDGATEILVGQFRNPHERALSLRKNTESQNEEHSGPLKKKTQEIRSENTVQPKKSSETTISQTIPNVLQRKEEAKIAAIRKNPAVSEPKMELVRKPNKRRRASKAIVVAQANVLVPKESSAAPKSVSTLNKGETPKASPRNQLTDGSHPARGVGAATVVEPSAESTVTATKLEGQILGRLSSDDFIADYLEETQGHIELALYDTSSKASRSAVRVPYEYPGENFQISVQGWTGKYRLYANLFTANQAEPIATIPYPEILDSTNYRSHIRFHLSQEEFEKYQLSRPSRRQLVNLSLTVFEGGPIGYKSPPVIPNASVSIIGLPITLNRETDHLGNAWFANLPMFSEYLIRIRAEGYYDTYRTIPVQASDSYESIFLVKKTDVQNVTEFFTKHPQSFEMSVMMGRTYNDKSRAPQRDQRIRLAGRTGSPVYFQDLSGLPDFSLTQTSASGLFSFFNVAPGFRVMEHVGRYPLVLNMRKGAAQFVEFGRMGSADLSGKVIDPYLKLPIEGEIRLLGARNPIPLEEGNSFMFPKVNLPNDVLTLELKATGYKTTWFNLPWDARFRAGSRRLYLVSEELIEERAHLLRISPRSHLGTLVGGANRSLFEGIDSCIKVNLIPTSGSQVEKGEGPFPLVSSEDAQPLCLTPSSSGFVFYNLAPGEYVLNWQTDTKLLRTRIIRVGRNRVTMVVN